MSGALPRSGRHAPEHGAAARGASPGASTAARAAPARDSDSRSRSRLRAELEALLAPRTSPRASLAALRRSVLLHGVPEQRDARPLRGRLWKVLLGVAEVDAADYEELVRRGPSPQASSIAQDVFRTFASSREYDAPAAALARVLNAFAWWAQGRPVAAYAQGYNVLCAPLLMCMPSEVDAWAALRSLVGAHLGGYFRDGSLAGVHAATGLFMHCLQELDADLAAHMAAANDHYATLFAFPRLISMFACRPPLGQLLRLWDALFAFGTHLAPLVAVAELLLRRDELMAAERPLLLLDVRTVPPMDAKLLTSMALHLSVRLSDETFARLLRHSRRPPPARAEAAAAAKGDAPKGDRPRATGARGLVVPGEAPAARKGRPAASRTSRRGSANRAHARARRTYGV